MPHGIKMYKFLDNLQYANLGFGNNLIEYPARLNFELKTRTFHLPTMERNTIAKALNKYNSQRKAAEALGISERSLSRKVKQYNLG